MACSMTWKYHRIKKMCLRPLVGPHLSRFALFSALCRRRTPSRCLYLIVSASILHLTCA